MVEIKLLMFRDKGECKIAVVDRTCIGDGKIGYKDFNQRYFKQRI